MWHEGLNYATQQNLKGQRRRQQQQHYLSQTAADTYRTKRASKETAAPTNALGLPQQERNVATAGLHERVLSMGDSINVDKQFQDKFNALTASQQIARKIPGDESHRIFQRSKPPADFNLSRRSIQLP